MAVARLGVALSCLASAAAVRNFTVAAYLPEWRYEGANFASMSRTVTQLILFSLEVQPTGRLSAHDRLPRAELMLEARAATKAAGTQLLVCVGGNGRSAGFSAAVAKPDRRQRFVEDLVKLCDKHDLDGVDLNWEYPGFTFGSGYHSDAAVQKDYKGLRALLKLLHAAFVPTGRVITIAYYPDGRQERLFTEYEVGKYVVNMHAMAYDQSPGQHSTWEFAQKVVQQGATLLPAHLVTLGLPFYGRHVRTGEWKSYEDLVQEHSRAAGGSLQPADEWALRDEAAGYFFNGPALIERKTRLALEAGLGGVMIWEGGQDCRVHAVTHGATTHAVTCPHGEASALLTAIRKGAPYRAPPASPVDDPRDAATAPDTAPHDATMVPDTAPRDAATAPDTARDPCVSLASAVCAGQPCYLDARCLATSTDPFKGAGCGAGGYPSCRACYVDAYRSILAECPELEKTEL